MSLDSVIETSPALWMATSGIIKNKAGNLVRPKPNDFQKFVSEVIEWCIENNERPRIVILKPRQKGSSTVSCACVYTFLRRFSGARCALIGDELDTSNNLAEIFSRYADMDDHAWGNEWHKTKLAFSNDSSCHKETANDPRAGMSSTFQVVLASEVAHWKKRGERNAESVLLSILNCVPDEPKTLVIVESTPNGASGAFYERWQKAVWFEDFKKGKKGNGFIRVFWPWYSFADSVETLPAQKEEEIKESLTDSERNLMGLGATIPNLAWRRRIVGEKCGGDAELFNQEYPTDDVSCFLTSGRPRFDRSGVERIEVLTRKKQRTEGVLDPSGNSVVFRPTGSAEAWLWLWEKPEYGRRYLIGVDTMTGASQVAGSTREPDCHSVIVLASGAFVLGKWIPPSVVGRLKPPCRVDIDVLALFVDRLSRFFGGCMVVPEVNNSGLALIELLKDAQTPIYQREIFNLRESKKAKALGWQTTEKTRTLAIETLATAIRDGDLDGGGINIYCPNILSELKTFVITDSGKAEAMSGNHDDDVLALSIAIATIDGATPYLAPSSTRGLPRDLLNAEKSIQANRRSYA